MPLATSSFITLIQQEVAVEEVGVDAGGIDGQRLLEQLLRLLVVSKAHRPARHLVVEGAQAGVGRAFQRLGILLDGDLELGT